MSGPATRNKKADDCGNALNSIPQIMEGFVGHAGLSRALIPQLLPSRRPKRTEVYSEVSSAASRLGRQHTCAPLVSMGRGGSIQYSLPREAGERRCGYYGRSWSFTSASGALPFSASCARGVATEPT